MPDIIHIAAEQTQKETNQLHEEFRKDVLDGLKSQPKYLLSKYFYDEIGSQLFNQITQHPDYYLTNCEIEILQKYAPLIAELMQHAPFNLIELGPGEGIKTALLLNSFSNKKIPFRYIPIDISRQFLTNLLKRLPHIETQPIHADYFKGLAWQCDHSKNANLVMFLGSSIGNFPPDDSINFLNNLQHLLNPNDYLLIGFDLKKPIPLLMRAYDDNAGITRAFNLNLLKRINKELDGEFNLNNFSHHATYNARIGAMESYLLSLKKQKCYIGETSISFDEYESIHMEYSFKYTIDEINYFAATCGFELIDTFYDSKKYFTDVLFKVKK